MEAQLLLQDVDSHTKPWQHDNACIRLPAQLIRNICLSILALLRLKHTIFILVMIPTGIFLSISIVRGEFPLAPLMVGSFVTIAWGIYSKITEEEN